MAADDRFLPLARHVNAVPEGLLDVLGVKSQGRYPDTLDGSVQLILDPFDLYAIPRLEYANEAGGPLSLVGTASTFCALTVPAGEIWWVKAYAWVGTLGAGMTTKIRVFAGIPNLAGNSADDSEVDAGCSGTTGDRIRAVKRNFWAYSGWAFGAQAITNTGGPANVFSAIWQFSRYRR